MRIVYDTYEPVFEQRVKHLQSCRDQVGEKHKSYVARREVVESALELRKLAWMIVLFVSLGLLSLWIYPLRHIGLFET